MSDLRLDADGDIDITGGDASLVTGADAIAQQIRIRLLFARGEWFADRREGLPYFENILTKVRDLSLVRSLLREAVAKTPGVVSVPVMTVSLDPTTRSLSVTFEATTEEGLVIGSETLSAPFLVGGA